jgi:hypothetical protein
MKDLLNNTKIVIGLGIVGLIVVGLGVTEKWGAYDMVDYQKGKLDAAITALEAAEGTPAEAEKKADVENWDNVLDGSLQTASSRSGRGMLWMLLGGIPLILSLVQLTRLRKAGSTTAEPVDPPEASTEEVTPEAPTEATPEASTEEITPEDDTVVDEGYEN